MPEPDILLSEPSPSCPIETIVEQDERVAYLYLHGEPDTDFGVKSCWVRNLAPAPETIDFGSMSAGTAQMLHRACCAHPEGAEPLDSSRLKLVWFEEGDAVALLEGDDVLAVLPSWSGYKGFAGYARDCTAESDFAWPLQADNVLLERVRQAEEFWRAWEDGNPWPGIQKSFLSAYERELGPQDKYHAIDGGKWPPRALLRIPIPPGTALVTAGMSIRPQPDVETCTDDTRSIRRIELGMAVRGLPDEAVRELMEFISAASAYPWRHMTWFGHGHTLSCDAIPNGPDGDAFPAVLLSAEGLGRQALSLPEVHGDPVRMLWMAPITQKERDLAEDQGGRLLMERLAVAGCSWVYEPRSEVGL